MAEKQLVITEVGNALMLQLEVYVENPGEDHGKPIAILNTAPDADLGKAVRKVLATRVRTRKKEKEGAAGMAGLG